MSEAVHRFFWTEMELVVALLLLLLLAMVSCAATGGVMTLERASPPSQALSFDAVDRDRARHARIFNGIVNFPLAGNFRPDGLYYTKVMLGTPPKAFHLQIDTGSDISWMSCSECTTCPTSTDLELNSFNLEASSTAAQVPCLNQTCNYSSQTYCLESDHCGYKIGYMDGDETTGILISDILSFGAITPGSVENYSAYIAFGLLVDGGLTSKDRALDGILGLGPGHLSVSSQILSRQKTPRGFSHFLRSDGNGGGMLTLGQISDPNIVYSPLLTSDYYTLDLLSISVGGQLLDIDPSEFAKEPYKGAIIDSGTALAYLGDKVYDAFVNAVTAYVSHTARYIIVDGFSCYRVRRRVSEVFPPVGFNFAANATMCLKPDEYLIRHLGDNKPCIGFSRAQDGLIVLGDLALRDKIVVYDLSHKQIGWANSNCSSSFNMSFDSSSINNKNSSSAHQINIYLFLLFFCRNLLLFFCLILGAIFIYIAAKTIGCKISLKLLRL